MHSGRNALLINNAAVGVAPTTYHAFNGQTHGVSVVRKMSKTWIGSVLKRRAVDIIYNEIGDSCETISLLSDKFRENNNKDILKERDTFLWHK